MKKYYYLATGSGKSTLIELILGLLKPCAGKIQVENQNFMKISTHGLKKLDMCLKKYL